MNAREREVMDYALIVPEIEAAAARSDADYNIIREAAEGIGRMSAEIARLRALIADTRAGEGVEAVAEVRGDPAPANSLPSWDECKRRVENSDFLADREANGGYGAEHDSKVASALHRFIYEYDDASHYRSGWFLHRLELVLEEARRPQPAQGGQGQQEPVPADAVIATSDRELFDRLRRSQRWCELASHDGNDEFAGLAYDLREAAAFVESAQSKEQGQQSIDPDAPVSSYILDACREWASNRGHGENCYLSDHYEGDPGNQCNCGLDGLLADIESAQSQTPPKEQDCEPCDGTGNKFGGFSCDFCNGTGKQLSPEETHRVADIISSGDIIPQEQGQRREITDEDVIRATEVRGAEGARMADLPYTFFVPMDLVRSFARAVLEWYESTRAPQPHGASAGSDARTALVLLYRAYVNLLEIGRDKIRELGGECDPVDVMERSDPHLIQARRVIDALATPSQPSCVQDARDGESDHA